MWSALPGIRSAPRLKRCTIKVRCIRCPGVELAAATHETVRLRAETGDLLVAKAGADAALRGSRRDLVSARAAGELCDIRADEIGRLASELRIELDYTHQEIARARIRFVHVDKKRAAGELSSNMILLDSMTRRMSVARSASTILMARWSSLVCQPSWGADGTPPLASSHLWRVLELMLSTFANLVFVSRSSPQPLSFARSYWTLAPVVLLFVGSVFLIGPVFGPFVLCQGRFDTGEVQFSPIELDYSLL